MEAKFAQLLPGVALTCYSGPMTIFGRLYQTARVIGWAVFPLRRVTAGKTGPAGTDSGPAPTGPIRLRSCDLPVYLADFNRAIDRQGRLTILFPGCLVVAAPFLLYRLKRAGFSACRAVASAEGVLLTASR